jgi:hypothetical protein
MRGLLCGLFALGAFVLLASDASVHGQGKGKGKGQGKGNAQFGKIIGEAAKAGVHGRDLAELIKGLKPQAAPQPALQPGAKPGAAKGAQGGAAAKKGAAK